MKIKWQPTSAVSPGKSHGQRSLAGYRSWGRAELDTTVHTHTKEKYSAAALSATFYLNALPLYFILLFTTKWINKTILLS